MFTRSLSYFTQYVPPKIYPKLNHYISYLEQQRDEAFARYPKAGYETTGMALLEEILYNADIPTIRTVSDPFDQYQNMVLPIISQLERIFDPTYNAVSTYGSFIHGQKKCSEYLIACAAESPYTDYPLGKGWDDWSVIRPLKMLNIDSAELTFQAYMDALVFKHDPPSYAVFSLDCTALILQYIAYLNDGTEECTITDYLHKYVILPCLLSDSLNLWLMKHYAEIIRCDDFVASKIDFSWVTATNVKLGSFYAAAFSDVKSLIDLVRNGSITPPGALSSLPLLDGKTVQSYYAQLSKTVSVPNTRQYIWAQYMRDEICLYLIITLSTLYKDLPDYKHLMINLKWDLSLLDSSRFWHTIRNHKLSTHILKGLGAFLQLVKA